MGFHSLEKTNPLKEIQEFLNEEREWPDVPNFITNQQKIIDEFFDKYNETSSIFFNLSDQ